ncbi:hypothetical protein V8F20_002030, partial [Naviculisporaceae sp. PSN 640]
MKGVSAKPACCFTILACLSLCLSFRFLVLRHKHAGTQKLDSLQVTVAQRIRITFLLNSSLVTATNIGKTPRRADSKAGD